MGIKIINIQLCTFFSTLIFGMIPLFINNSFSQQYTEYEVKTAYIFNFSKFIEWPDSAMPGNDKPFIIGIFGDDRFTEIFPVVIADRQIKGKDWTIKVYKEPQEINCQILIITSAEKNIVNNLLSLLKNKPVLTIGDDIDNFCESGGIINFTLKHANKQFEINNEAALRANLIISSKLLTLAKIVKYDENIY
ncbi:MAG: YfiR family protein [Bacteroidia bacterium]|nr:YfiR family protein [Bacteroidia bacterium]